MKRTFKIEIIALLILVMPFSFVLGQDKKSEQKINIIVDDGDGTRVVIDTLIKVSPEPDSIVTKNGTVVYLKNSEGESISKNEGGKKHFLITYSTRGEDIDGGCDGKTVDVYVSGDDNEKTGEKSTYVIAKDGIVVTIEGNDETKTNDLAKEIEKKLGVHNDGSENKENVKVETNQTPKK
jgi:hypothetical protein